MGGQAGERAMDTRPASTCVDTQAVPRTDKEATHPLCPESSGVVPPEALMQWCHSFLPQLPNASSAVCKILAQLFDPTCESTSWEEPFRALPAEERKTLQPIMHTLYNNISQLLDQVGFKDTRTQQDAETEHPPSSPGEGATPVEDAGLDSNGSGTSEVDKWDVCEVARGSHHQSKPKRQKVAHFANNSEQGSGGSDADGGEGGGDGGSNESGSEGREVSSMTSGKTDGRVSSKEQVSFGSVEGSAGMDGSNSNGSHRGSDAGVCKGQQSSGDAGGGSKGSGSNASRARGVASNAGSDTGRLSDRRLSLRPPGPSSAGGHDGQSQREYHSGGSSEAECLNEESKGGSSGEDRKSKSPRSEDGSVAARLASRSQP